MCECSEIFKKSSSGLMDRIVLLHVGKFKKANLFECEIVWTILTYAAEMRPNATKTKQSNKATYVKYL
jgi:hypothetical protein